MNGRLKYEKRLWQEGYKRIMGLDEVGRGCLAGPVVAAGVIFEPGTYIKEIRDSKIVAETERDELCELIKEKALYWTIQHADIKEVDRLNILWASISAMVKCAECENAAPDYLLVDGNKFTSSLIPYSCIVKGDNLSMSIAAASIIAKVHRDKLMRKLHLDYPEFEWRTNVGYPTAAHRKALKKYGYTEHHRLSFSLGTDKKYGLKSKSA